MDNFFDNYYLHKFSFGVGVFFSAVKSLLSA